MDPLARTCKHSISAMIYRGYTILDCVDSEQGRTVIVLAIGGGRNGSGDRGVRVVIGRSLPRDPFPGQTQKRPCNRQTLPELLDTLERPCRCQLLRTEWSCQPDFASSFASIRRICLDASRSNLIELAWSAAMAPARSLSILGVFGWNAMTPWQCTSISNHFVGKDRLHVGIEQAN